MKNNSTIRSKMAGTRLGQIRRFHRALKSKKLTCASTQNLRQSTIDETPRHLQAKLEAKRSSMQVIQVQFTKSINLSGLMWKTSASLNPSLQPNLKSNKCKLRYVTMKRKQWPISAENKNKLNLKLSKGLYEGRVS